MRSLGPLETAVMEVLWKSAEPMSVRQVADALRDRGLAYTTLATVLDNLHRKEWVDRDRVGRAWFYRPRMRSSEYAARVMREALAASDSPRATFLKFVEEITDDEAAMLRELLAEDDRRERR